MSDLANNDSHAVPNALSPRELLIDHGPNLPPTRITQEGITGPLPETIAAALYLGVDPSEAIAPLFAHRL